MQNIHYLTCKYLERFFIDADITKPWNSWLTQIPFLSLRELEYIFHFASPHRFQKYSLGILQANSIALENAIHYADQLKARVIFASTSEVYESEVQSSYSEHQ